MTRFNNNLIKIELPVRTRYARPKGRKFSNISVSLTEEQIVWLATKPNASELLRKILQDLIDAGKNVEKDLGVISLHKQIEELEAQKDRLLEERKQFIQKGSDMSHFDKILWGESQASLNDLNIMPTPLVPENPEVQVAFKIIEKYKEAINKIDAEINKLKNDILQS